jgi:hypothetical protein
MKSIYLIITCLSLLATSCCQITDPFSIEIQGSDTLITEQRELPTFHSISMSTAGTVYIAQGSEQKVTVTVNDNLVSYIEMTVSNGKLKIGIADNVSVSDMDLTVIITMTELKALAATSAGSIFGTTEFSADDVSIKLSSAGDIRLNLVANQLSSNLSSAGSLHIEGEVARHNATLSSAGNLHAFNLMTETTVVDVSSAGYAEVYATNWLVATLSSAGSVYYKGNPTIEQHISSSGRIRNKN